MRLLVVVLLFVPLQVMAEPMSGFYAGGFLSSDNASLSVLGDTQVSVGATGGYRLREGRLVFGGEVDASTTFSGDLVFGVGLSAGVLVQTHVLAYFQTGWEFVDARSFNADGLRLGLGLEAAITQSWSMYLDFAHHELGTSGLNINHDRTRLGFRYYFSP